MATKWLLLVTISFALDISSPTSRKFLIALVQDESVLTTRGKNIIMRINKNVADN